MIVGIGLDIEEISRFESILVKRRWLLTQVFSDRERALFDAAPRPAVAYAAGFALKEAAFKALGEGWLESALFWTDIELLSLADHGRAGAHAQVELSGAAMSGCRRLGIDRVVAVVDTRGPRVVAQVWLLQEGPSLAPA